MSVQIGETRNINFYVARMAAIPQLGDTVTANLSEEVITGILLAYNELSWTSKAELKVTGRVKILDVKDKGLDSINPFRLLQ